MATSRTPVPRERNFLSFVFLITALWAFPSLASGATCGDDEPFKAHRIDDPKLDTAAYLSRIAVWSSSHQHMGYAVVLHNNRGKRLLFYRRGWAVTPCDTNFAAESAAFTLDTKINIGSTGKAVATTPSVLHLVEHRSDVNLGSYFGSFLPVRWSADLHPRWGTVTISQMLQHRGGFKKSGNNHPWSASNARARLAGGDLTGDLPPAVGDRNYSNASMGMFHFLMLAMGQHSSWFHYETIYAHLPESTYDTSIAARQAEYHNAYTKKFVFEPADVQANCRMQDIVDNGGPFSLMYSSKSDLTGAVSSDNTWHCAAGGWIMSIKELMRLLYTLRHTDKILSRDTYALMEDRTLATGEDVVADDESLGWWRARIRGGWAFRHNGQINQGGGTANSHVILYPNGYYAAIVSNSGIPDGVDPDKALVDAYESSLIVTPGVDVSLPGITLRPRNGTVSPVDEPRLGRFNSRP